VDVFYWDTVYIVNSCSCVPLQKSKPAALPPAMLLHHQINF